MESSGVDSSRVKSWSLVESGQVRLGRVESSGVDSRVELSGVDSRVETSGGVE